MIIIIISARLVNVGQLGMEDVTGYKVFSMQFVAASTYLVWFS
uniref:Uncharacterized protein n=1 Tax=Anguilla anguilla TaxID=7936 RepID=A0A0E9QK44_ANGAN